MRPFCFYGKGVYRMNEKDIRDLLIALYANCKLRVQVLRSWSVVKRNPNGGVKGKKVPLIRTKFIIEIFARKKVHDPTDGKNHFKFVLIEDPIVCSSIHEVGRRLGVLYKRYKK